MSKFERYLTLWVALCIVLGVGLGRLFPSTFHYIGAAQIAHVNLPVAALIWSSGAALATVVGVLIEVPVMLSGGAHRERLAQLV